ncbi:Tripartite motif-containing protein 59-like 1 [Homarus americanus]|uniref:Tripartite motif-containing protein 59-like 1 n=1 Tax=Homarus americanus TaxID=6706 RepID=A0A8J5N1P1_HOMAM|nr:Tripartite motif-containing protein 59-like 1 [Homarus americanus]
MEGRSVSLRNLAALDEDTRPSVVLPVYGNLLCCIMLVDAKHVQLCTVPSLGRVGRAPTVQIPRVDHMLTGTANNHLPPVYSRLLKMEYMEVTCGICELQFHDDNNARNLPCGHSLCTSCVDELLTRDKKCPECRINITVSTSQELPIGYTLMRLARACGEINKQQQKEDSSSDTENETQPDAGKCKIHSSRLFFRCQTCEVWVCRDCIALEHRLPPQGQCRVVYFVQALDEAKESYAMTTSLEKRVISHLKDELNTAKSNFTYEKTESQQKITYFEMQMNYYQTKVEEVNKLLNKLESYPKSLETAEDNIAKAETPSDLIAATQAGADHSNSLKYLVIEVEKMMRQFPPGASSGILKCGRTGVFNSILSSQTSNLFTESTSPTSRKLFKLKESDLVVPSSSGVLKKECKKTVKLCNSPVTGFSFKNSSKGSFTFGSLSASGSQASSDKRDSLARLFGLSTQSSSDKSGSSASIFG